MVFTLECPDASRIWMNESCVDALGLVGVGLVALADVSFDLLDCSARKCLVPTIARAVWTRTGSSHKIKRSR